MTAIAQSHVFQAEATQPSPVQGNTTQATTLVCPECGADVVLTQVAVLHEILPCCDCGAELEVIAVDPLRVDLAPEVEEDWGE